MLKKILKACWFGALLPGVLTLPVQALEVADLDLPGVAEAFVDGLVKSRMAEGHSPSGVFMLMKDGKLVVSKGYGWQDVDQRIPVDPKQTLFRPGSISKLFTWVSVMQQVERGRLDLDVDINTYLKTFQIEDSYPGRPVTLRHCMTHTAGFEDGFLGYLIIDEVDRIIPLADAMKRYQPARVNPPGAVGAYSNYCTSLSGLVVANVSGKSFSDYVTDNIFTVLGMDNSSFEGPLPDALAQHMAIAYKYQGGEYVERPYELISNFVPAGALAATAEDMLRFASALLNGGSYQGARILKASSLAEMTRNQFSYDSRLKGMGQGFLLYPWGETDTFGHDGATTAFFSHLGITPSANMVVFSSFSGPGGAEVNGVLTRSFYREFFAKPLRNDSLNADFGQRGERYAGTFLLWRSNFTTVEKLMSLASQVSVGPDGRGGLMIGEQRFIEIEERLFRNTQTGELVAFQEDSEGEITGYVRDGWPVLAMHKVGAQSNVILNGALLGFSLVVLVGVLLRFCYQRDRYRAQPKADQRASRAALLAAVSHVSVFVFGAVMLALVGEQLIVRIPGLFKLWLLLPILASTLSVYLCYQTVLIWKNGLLSGAFVRFRFTLVCLCALLITWFYYFWNILGFNYLG